MHSLLPDPFLCPDECSMGVIASMSYVSKWVTPTHFMTLSVTPAPCHSTWKAFNWPKGSSNFESGSWLVYLWQTICVIFSLCGVHPMLLLVIQSTTFIFLTMLREDAGTLCHLHLTVCGSPPCELSLLNFLFLLSFSFSFFIFFSAPADKTWKGSIHP